MPAKIDYEALFAALQDNDENVRHDAVKRIVRRPDARAFEPLLVALKDKNWGVREMAAKGLGRIGDSSAVPPLSQALKDKSAKVRKAAVQALAGIGSDTAIESLTQMLADPKVSVRRSTVEAFFDLGLPAVPLMCRTLQSPNEVLRRNAEGVLTLLYYPQHFRRETPFSRVLMQRELLAAPALTPEQRWMALETLRKACPRFWIPNFLANIGKFCEGWAKSNDVEAARGARSILDYMTLARASQRDISQEQNVLLRPASGTNAPLAVETLLRAADAENLPVSPPESLVSRLRRKLIGF